MGTLADQFITRLYTLFYGYSSRRYVTRKLGRIINRPSTKVSDWVVVQCTSRLPGTVRVLPMIPWIPVLVTVEELMLRHPVATLFDSLAMVPGFDGG